MRIAIALVYAAILALTSIPHAQAQTKLGGLACFDNLSTIFRTLQTPEAINARRMLLQADDYAVLRYQKQGMVAVGLTGAGDKLEFLLTESPALTTNDGLKVGDPVSTVVAKLGQPEDTGSEIEGMTEYWYWSKGINFGVDDRTKTVANVYMFPPGTPETTEIQTETIMLPSNKVDLRHQYKITGGKAYVTGSIQNKTPGTLRSVRLGLTFRDKNGRTVDTLTADAGSVLANENIPFNISVPPKGKWSSYSVTVQAVPGGTTAASKARVIRIKQAHIPARQSR